MVSWAAQQLSEGNAHNPDPFSKDVLCSGGGEIKSVLSLLCHAAFFSPLDPQLQILMAEKNGEGRVAAQCFPLM